MSAATEICTLRPRHGKTVEFQKQNHNNKTAAYTWGQDRGASPREALSLLQAKRAGTEWLPEPESKAVWRGPPPGPCGVSGPPSPSSRFWSSAGTSHSESQQNQRPGSPLTMSVWALGEHWLSRDK